MTSSPWGRLIAGTLVCWACGVHGEPAVAAPLPANPVLSLYAGQQSEQGSQDGTTLTARFYAPGGIAVDAGGNLYIADTGNHTIRKITPGGTVTTLAGSAGQRGEADGIGAAARFNVPSALCIDAQGNLYVADTYGNTIRMISPGGMVTTLAGLASEKGSADGQGAAARFYLPQGIAVDAARNLYVADTYNNTIRMIKPGGVVTTLAGAAGLGGGDDGTGAAARFDLPAGIAVSATGELYVADQGNSTIRTVSPAGVVRTLAGRAARTGFADGPAGRARFHYPFGIAAGRSGNVYVTDTGNHVVRVMTAEGKVTTLIGAESASGNAPGANGVSLSFPGGIAALPSGDALLYLIDGNAILKVR